MRRSGAPDHIGILVAVKDRLHALKNPYAHLHIEDISFDMVKDSIMLWDPLRYLETCPSSDGAAAMVLASEKAAGGVAATTGRPPAWIHGMAMRSEPTMFAGRDQVNPQAGRDCAADVYRQAGITDPRADRHGRGVRALQLVRADVAREPRLLRRGRRVEADRGRGHVVLDGGDIPWNCSGGVLSSNPIGASGMLRFLEVAMQVRGQAGEHQVATSARALGHAYGGGSQFFAMWVLGADKP